MGEEKRHEMMETLFGAESEDSDDEPETVRQAVSDQGSDRSVSFFLFLCFFSSSFYPQSLPHPLLRASLALSAIASLLNFPVTPARQGGHHINLRLEFPVHTAFIHSNTCAKQPNLHTKFLSSNFSYPLP